LDPSAVSARLAEIRRRIAAACARAGRGPDEVVLVGAAKTQPVERLRAARAAGLAVFGENRVQEAEEHRAALDPEGAGRGLEWHLIGPLQSNKARRAASLFDAFHAVDRVKIALALERELAALGRTVPAFAEVNLGGEESKHGFLPERLPAALAPLAGLAHLRIVGLMAVPPPDPAGAEAARPWFRRLRELAEELRARPEWAGFPARLSMGMSDDFEVAIEEGATHVRVGTLLFGARGGPA
jgi:pyridoxal phosphate enzyme (YggS family)